MAIRFRFHLRLIAEISPWGPSGQLHWFGLTDGWYWIEMNGLELLRYTPGALQGRDGGGQAVSSPYVDYYVARFWEDVLGLLPRALEPVPDDLADFMSSDPDDWVTSGEEQAESAAEWYGGHVLDMGYVSCPPSIRWWRRSIDGQDHTTVAWKHRSGEVEFAGPHSGQTTMPTSEFVAAVEEFDRELLTAMDLRIAELEHAGPPPGVQIDMQGVRAEQQDRATWLQRQRAQKPKTDWARVRAGANVLLGR